jgi:hypothetical protein
VLDLEEVSIAEVNVGSSAADKLKSQEVATKFPAQLVSDTNLRSSADSRLEAWTISIRGASTPV